MIILDTNVVTELTNPTPHPAVASWVEQYLGADVFTTAVTAAELLYGATRLPNGRRKQALLNKVQDFINDDLHAQVLPFDHAAASRYANIYATRERLGRPIGVADAQIAAICHHYSATLVTRNVKDFEYTGVEVVNPWEPTPTSPG